MTVGPFRLAEPTNHYRLILIMMLQDGMMLPFTGFGTRRDPADPTQKISAHVFIFEGAPDGHVRMTYKPFMSSSEVLPEPGPGIPRGGVRVFVPTAPEGKLY